MKRKRKVMSEELSARLFEIDNLSNISISEIVEALRDKCSPEMSTYTDSLSNKLCINISKNIFPNVDHNKKSKTLVDIKIKQGSENLHKGGFYWKQAFEFENAINDNGEKLSNVLESVSKANENNTDTGNLYNELKEIECERDKIVQNMIAFYDAELNSFPHYSQ